MMTYTQIPNKVYKTKMTRIFRNGIFSFVLVSLKDLFRTASFGYGEAIFKCLHNQNMQSIDNVRDPEY